MGAIKDLCRDMGANPQVMTFSDIGTAAAKGALAGERISQPLIGAVLGVSIEASKRALLLSEQMLAALIDVKQNHPEQPKESVKPTKPKRPKPRK